MKFITLVLILSILLSSCTLGEPPENGKDSTEATTDVATMSQEEIDAILESSVDIVSSGPWWGYISFDNDFAYQLWIENVDVAEFEGLVEIGMYCHYEGVDKWILAMRTRGLPAWRKNGDEWRSDGYCLYSKNHLYSEGAWLSRNYDDATGERVLEIDWVLLNEDDTERLTNDFETEARRMSVFASVFPSAGAGTATVTTLRFQNAEYPAIVWLQCTQNSDDAGSASRAPSRICVFLEEYNMVVKLTLMQDMSMEQIQQFAADSTLS